MRCISHISTPEFKESLKAMTFWEIADLMELSRQAVLWHVHGFKKAQSGLWLIAEHWTNCIHLRAAIEPTGPGTRFMYAGPFTEGELKQPWLQATMVGPKSLVKRFADPANKDITLAGDYLTWWSKT